MISLKSNHAVQAHKNDKDKVMGFREEKTLLVTASTLLPQEQHAWTCPKCGAGLPPLKKSQKELAAKTHLGSCFPTEKERTALRKQQSTKSAQVAKKVCRERCKLRTEEVNRVTGHDLVKTEIRRQRACLLVCRKCCVCVHHANTIKHRGKCRGRCPT